MNTPLNENGFTLIEALMSMMVMSVGILALYSLQVSSTQGNATSNHLTTASVSGVSCYERLLGMPYDDPTLTPGVTHTQNEIAGLQLQSNVSSVTWTITEWSNTDGNDNDGDGQTDETDERNVKLVQLTVSYSDRSAKALTLEFLKTEMY